MRRKIFRYLRLLFIVGVVGGLIYLVAWSHVLVVKKIEINGTKSTDAITLLLLQGKQPIHIGEPLARVDVNVIERELRGVDWISKVGISRNWIHGILALNLTLRNPVASYVDGAGITHYFDSTGAVFTHYEGNGSLPVVTLGDESPALKASVAALFTSLTPELLSEATAFTAHSANDVEMTIQSPSAKIPFLIKFGDTNYLDLKLKVLARLFSITTDPKVHIFDVSTPLAPITK